MHPHKSEASETSRAKMRAITGRGGGGTGFIGASSFKRAGADGEQKSYLGHEKVFAAPKAAGGKVKRRADRFARGGKVKKAGGGATGTGPKFGHTIEHGHDLPGTFQRSVDENPQEVNRRWLGPMGQQKEATTMDEMDEFNRVAPGYQRDYGHVSPWGVPLEESPSAPTPAEDVPQSRHGGRIKRADGGRTMMPYGNEPRRRVVGKSTKKAGNVNIAINMPPHVPHLGGGMPPPMPPPGGAGGPSGMPPGGGAPPPPIPPALMGGAGGLPGGLPGAGGAPGGMNPAAMQALAGIAGGQGGPMGAGMPGRGPFAKGGAVKSTGLASNLGHWRDYATKNVRGNSAQNRGATGESEELPLRTPDHVKGASDAAVAQRRGGRGEGRKYAKGGKVTPGGTSFNGQYGPKFKDKSEYESWLDRDLNRAKGGRTKRARGGKIPVPMTGGSESGVGRKRMAELQPKYR